MAERPSSGSSRRAKGDDAIGQFVIDQEIGKGSFAQVYSGRHKVSLISGCRGGVSEEPTSSITLVGDLAMNPPYIIFLPADTFALGHRGSCRHQIRRPRPFEQKAQGESLLRDQDPQEAPPPPYRRPT